MASRAGSEEIRWVVEILKVILNNGGSVTLEEIIKWTKDKCRRQRLNEPNVQDVIQQNLTRFFYIDDGSAMNTAVAVKINLTLCENHWTKDGCKDANCMSIHICRYFMTSSCKELQCRFGHNFQDEHNGNIISKYGLIHHLSNEELKAAFRPRVMTPDVCKFYNNIGGCKKEGGRGCPALHICLHFVTNECKFGQRCKRSHNIFDQQPKFILSRLGWNLSRSPKDVIADYKLLYERHHLDDHINPPTAAARVSSALPVSTNHSQLNKPSICTFYNTAKGCKNNDSCKHIHLCKHLVENNCQHGASCRRSHNLLDSQPRRILESLGWNMQRNPDNLLEDLQSLLSTVSARPSSTPGQASASGSNTKLPSPGHKPTSQPGIKDVTSDDDENPMICPYFLKGDCSYGTKCNKRHVKGSYLWEYTDRYKGKDVWVQFNEDDNKSIEMCYTDPQCDECYAQIGASSGAMAAVRIDFDSMTYSSTDLGKGRVRRLGTYSWGSVPLHKPYVTKWLWYWKTDTDEWIEYGKQQRKASSTDVSSRDFEENFVQKRNDFLFHTENFTYKANLKEMYQVNSKVGTKRPIRRRPSVIGSEPSSSVLQRTESYSKSSEISYPDHWDYTAGKSEVSIGFQLVKIHKQGKTANEFARIEKLFQKTLPCPVKSVLRIQNFDLWEDYQRKKTKLSKASRAGNVTEKHLFHATRSEFIPAICQQGFDWRLTGKSHGAVYGRGSYFARDSSYSSRYTDSRQMFVALVLVGQYARGRPDMVRPPPIDASKPLENFYHSCVDSVDDPSIFVVFEKEQSYPQYIIEY